MNDQIDIRFDSEQSESESTAVVDCVLDIGKYGDVVGIEILNLFEETAIWTDGSDGSAVLTSGKQVKWGYDDVVDAFYVTITDERAIDQRSARCTVHGAENGRITRIIVEPDVK